MKLFKQTQIVDRMYSLLQSHDLVYNIFRLKMYLLNTCNIIKYIWFKSLANR